MTAAIHKTVLAPALCEERLLGPGRNDDFVVWTVRNGEVRIRRRGPYDWIRWGRFFRIILYPHDGGTAIEVRRDMVLPLKIFATVWLGGVALAALMALAAIALGPFGFPRGTGSPVLALAGLTVMLAGGFALFFSGLGRWDRKMVVDFVRRELSTDRVGSAAEPRVAADGAAPCR
jgi:hypothetical protein